MPVDRSRVRNLLVYTVLRILLWLGVWAILQFLTPIKGALALIISLLLSGIISIIVLDRQRDAMSEGVGAFFGRINDRIEKAAAAEDYWQEPLDAPVPDSAPSQQSGGEQSVDEHEHPGHLQDGDQDRTDTTP
ncbi:MAG: DUF4229 domain-containing protein [Actinomycetota bacterium]|nr:DUF4229 domain-containing protein [Actinomycetota bacterium]